MRRGRGSVSIVVEEEKRGDSASIHALFPGRCQARWFSHALRKGMDGPQLALGVSGKTNTHLFRGYSPGNVPQRRRLFLMLCFALPHFLKPYRRCGRAFAAADSSAHWFNTVVFLPLALRQRTCTRFSCSRYYGHILFASAKNGNTGAKAEDTLPLPLKRRGLRWAKAPSVRLIVPIGQHNIWLKN